MNYTSRFVDNSFEVLFSKGISLRAGIRYTYTATSKMTTREYSNEYCYYRSVSCSGKSSSKRKRGSPWRWSWSQIAAMIFTSS